MRIGLFATGGTIAMRADAAGEGVVPRDGAAALLGGVALPAGIEVVHRDVLAKPSPSVDLADVRTIAEAIEAGFASGLDGAVVTHGTDTLEETAFALDLMLGETRPVVVTGAMRSADRIGADGPANLAAAICVAADPAAAGQGVLVLFGDEIHAARLVRKVHSARAHAFSSEPYGPVGTIFEDAVHFEFSARHPSPILRLTGGVPPVPIVQAGLGLEPETVAAFEGSGIAGLVVAGVGGGHVSERAVPALEALTRRIPVVITTRVAMGPTMRHSYAYPGGDVDLARRGIINGGRWRPAQARIVLQLALSAGMDARAVFERHAG